MSFFVVGEEGVWCVRGRTVYVVKYTLCDIKTLCGRWFVGRVVGADFDGWYYVGLWLWLFSA